MADQGQLWHDCIEDAIGTVVQVLGGAKRVAVLLWPALASAKPETAYTRLRHSLNPEKAEKFSLEEFLLLARKGREAGEHSIAKYFGHATGYEVIPLESEEIERRALNEKIQWHLSEASRLAQEIK
jgi:hypothetical protein